MQHWWGPEMSLDQGHLKVILFGGVFIDGEEKWYSFHNAFQCS